MRVGRATGALFTKKKVIGWEFVDLMASLVLLKSSSLGIFTSWGWRRFGAVTGAFACAYSRDKYVFLRYGARTPKDIVYKKQLKEWEKIKKLEIDLSVDSADEPLERKVGVVTCLMDYIPCDVKKSVAVVWGPPIMMKFVTKKLVEAGFPGSSIYLSYVLRCWGVWPLSAWSLF